MLALIVWKFSNFFSFYYSRRQTAEEREQERQAATKYFLSMQLGSLGSPTGSSSSATLPSATAAAAATSSSGSEGASTPAESTLDVSNGRAKRDHTIHTWCPCPFAKNL